MAEKKVETESPTKRNGTTKQEKLKKAPEYTREQLEAVKKINNCKNHYTVLGVRKNASLTEIRKAYKTLALKIHPDKNKSPGSAEAFKKIGKAIAILSDSEKRWMYNLFGPEDERETMRTQKYNTSQESDTHNTTDESDKAFSSSFSGVFNEDNVSGGREGGRQEQNTAPQESHYSDSQRKQQYSKYSAYVRLSPIILVLVFSMASKLFVPDPPYSLQPNSNYPISKTTINQRIPYYVKETFVTEYQGSVRTLEMSVEKEYISKLRQSCDREKNMRKAMFSDGQYFGDTLLLQRARNMEMPNCDKSESMRFMKDYL